jgi:cytochrome P450
VISYDPTSKVVCDDPFPHYAQLRAEAPVFKHPEFSPWFLSRFADITRALLDLRSHTVTEGTTPMELLYPADPNRTDPFEELGGGIEIGPVAVLDPPVHTRVRLQLNVPFKPGAAAKLEPLARQLVRERLALGREQGGLDAGRGLTGHLSVRIVSTILGLPLEDADRYSHWVNTMFDRGPSVREIDGPGAQAGAEFHAHLLDQIQHWRKHDQRLGGLGDVILFDDFEGRRLNDLEAAFHFSMLLIGGTETFPKVGTAAIYRLWQHPDQRAALAADPGLAPQAFNEALRFDMPTQMLGRTVVREMEFHGQRIEPGERLMFLWASANRDERQFERADQFDIQRGMPKILSFGHGAHTCMGAHVARMEGKVLLEELLAAVPNYEVVEAEASRSDSEFFRGFRSLPLRF